jgi:hypothetical protein
LATGVQRRRDECDEPPIPPAVQTAAFGVPGLSLTEARVERRPFIADAILGLVFAHPAPVDTAICHLIY